MQLLFRLSFLMFFIFGMASCVKDRPNPSPARYMYQEGHKAYIICEGNYGSGNASLSLWNADSQELMQQVFSAVNGTEMGDVFQSMCRVENRLYFSINHSDRILVCDRYSMQLISNIAVQEPRYFLPINSGKLYVSALNKPVIYVVNTLDQTITKEIRLSYTSAEGMIVQGSKVYACSWDTACAYIQVIDPLADEVVDSIFINGRAPQSIVSDMEGNLWVTYGNIQKSKPYGIVCINPLTKAILKQFHYEEGLNELIKPAMNATKDTLYWICVDYSSGSENNGIFRMPVHADVLPDQPFIAAAPFQYFYALEIDPRDNLIYIGDPKSFIESSEIMIYNSAGELHHQFTTGMGVGDFFFDE